MVEHTFVPPSDLAVEFHWYAGEEGGLLGSQDIAAAYENRGEQVKGMLHMDSKSYVCMHIVEIGLSDFADTPSDGFRERRHGAHHRLLRHRRRQEPN